MQLNSANDFTNDFSINVELGNWALIIYVYTQQYFVISWTHNLNFSVDGKTWILNIYDWVVFLALFTPTVCTYLGSGGVWSSRSQCHAHSGPGPAEGSQIWVVQNHFFEGAVEVGHLRRKFLSSIMAKKLRGQYAPPGPPGSTGPVRGLYLYNGWGWIGTSRRQWPLMFSTNGLNLWMK